MGNYVNVSGLNTAYQEASVSDYASYLPDGQYQAEIRSAAFKNSKDGNSIFYEWVFTVISGDYQDSRIRKSITLKSNTMWMLKADVHALGFKDLKDADEIQANQHRFVGLEVELRLETKERDGKTRQNIYIQRLLNVTAEQNRNGNDPPPPTDADIPF